MGTPLGLSGEQVEELKELFLADILGLFPEVKIQFDKFSVDPTNKEALEAIFDFFHRLAGTSRNVGLPLLGYVAVMAERVANELNLGRSTDTKTAALIFSDAMEAVTVELQRYAEAKALKAEETGDSSVEIAITDDMKQSIAPRGGVVVPARLGEGRELSKILVIDDDEFSAGMIDNCLRAAGFLSRYCCQPERALHVIESELPDLIVMDIIMPKIDGLELCRRIRSHPSLQDTPIIFVTRRGDLEQLVQGLEAGANDYISKPFEPQELIARVRSHLERLSNLREMAIRDGLTRCFNHRFFKLRIEQEVERGKRYNHQLCVAVVDIDNFKQVNDGHGHLAGDMVLSHMANVVVASVRSTDIVARYGGEEFAILMVHAGAPESKVVCNRLRERIAAYRFSYAGESDADKIIPITVSVGVAELAPITDTPSTLLRRADAALYAAKANGKNRVMTAPMPSGEKASEVKPA